MFIKMTGLDDNQVLHVDPKDIVYHSDDKEVQS